MKSNRGSILAIAIIFIFIFTLLGMFAMRLVILQNESSDSELYYTRAHFAALYGSEVALWRIMQWENIASNPGSVALNPDGRKFLAENSNCFNYSGGKWYPLHDYDFAVEESNFQDEISGGAGSGIDIECSVEIDHNPNINDGFIHNRTPGTYDEKYGTYKYYVINTKATMYRNLATKTGAISQAVDKLYFMIAYSTGPSGARALEDIEEINSAGKIIRTVPGFYNKDDAYMTGLFPMSIPKAEREAKIKEFTKHYTSAPRISLITGRVQPIFRYYIRGRR